MNNFENNIEILSEKQVELVSKSQIMGYQVKMKNAGTPVSWADAKKALEEPLIKAAKDAKKAAAAAKRAARPKKVKQKTISEKEFNKRVRGSGDDFVADTASDMRASNPELSKAESLDMARGELEQVAWDLAGSLMYDPEIDAYVRKHLADWQRKDPASIKATAVQEYIADNI